MQTFNLNLHLPAARLGEFELGRAEELVGRRLVCGRIFQGRSPGFAHADGHPHLRREISCGSILNQRANVDSAGSQRCGCGKNGDPIAALLSRQTQRAAVGARWSTPGPEKKPSQDRAADHRAHAYPPVESVPRICMGWRTIHTPAAKRRTISTAQGASIFRACDARSDWVSAIR